MTEEAEEYAEDVTDLRQAHYIIAALRQQIEEMEPIDGEYWVFLDDQYARKLELLYSQNKLVYDQDPDLRSGMCSSSSWKTHLICAGIWRVPRISWSAARPTAQACDAQRMRHLNAA